MGLNGGGRGICGSREVNDEYFGGYGLLVKERDRRKFGSYD